jgi:ribonuclease R
LDSIGHNRIKRNALVSDNYKYYEKEYLIKGRRHGKKFRLGDNVRVKVARINAFCGEIDFELIWT